MMVSVFMIALDEEEMIGQALSQVSAASAISEIVVVDGGSQDRTVEIALSFPKVKVVHRPWDDDFAVQKNHALSLCDPKNWRLRMDPDELFEDSFLDALPSLVAQSGWDCLLLPTFNFVRSGHWVKKTDWWYPDFHHILWRSASVRYVGKLHEKPKGVGRKHLTDKWHLFHYGWCRRDWEHQLRKVRLCERLGGVELSLEGLDEGLERFEGAHPRFLDPKYLTESGDGV